MLGQQRSGTPEQFATLITLIARELGVPARVVTGFRVLHDKSAILPAGTYPVTTAEAWTWAEVPILGKGWLALDATPGSIGSARTRTPARRRASPSRRRPAGAQITQKSDGGNAVAPPAEPPVETSTSSKDGLLVPCCWLSPPSS